MSAIHTEPLANLRQGLVLGTGDLSELALGWCTYGVGDQMSHYNVNASVSKTLIQHLIRWCAADRKFGAEAAPVLEAILATGQLGAVDNVRACFSSFVRMALLRSSSTKSSHL